MKIIAENKFKDNYKKIYNFHSFIMSLIFYIIILFFSNTK